MYTCEDLENFIEDEDILAFISAIYSLGQGPIELEYDLGSPLAMLLIDIPKDGKTKIALIIPI